MRESRLSKAECIVLAAFALLFAVAYVLGSHIVIDGDTYYGTASQNYIVPYGASDILALLIIWLGAGAAAMGVYWLIKRSAFKALWGASAASATEGQGEGQGHHSAKSEGTAAKHGKHTASPAKAREYEPVRAVPVCVMAAVIFACWVPYLVCYWPGFIFGDTLDSFAQIVGDSSLSNHHPVMFTLVIKACFKLAAMLGHGNGAGCVIYCVSQMAFMALCLAYTARWVCLRWRLRNWVGWIIGLAFALSPYVATFSIAIWKDPLFSVVLVVLGVMLLDFVSYGASVVRRPLWVIAFALMAMVALFWRNNGVFILALLAIVLFAMLLRTASRARKASQMGFAATFDINSRGSDAPPRSGAFDRMGTRPIASLLGICCCCLAAYAFISGPVYKAMGVVASEKVESVGIMLNQMARVVATGGEMSEEDAAYMDSILPLDQYAEKYRPTCTDLLKWDSEFNSEPLESGFFSHWLSMLVKNPVTYFEAWELETFGFWAVNQPLTYESGNIDGGVPRNVYEDYADDLEYYGIDASAGLADDIWHEIFYYDSTSIPVGVLTWVVLYLATCLALLGRGADVLALVPSLGLLATLLLASPIWYWPRYGAAIQLSIPVYAYMFYRAAKPSADGRATKSPQAS